MYSILETNKVNFFKLKNKRNIPNVHSLTIIDFSILLHSVGIYKVSPCVRQLYKANFDFLQVKEMRMK